MADVGLASEELLREKYEQLFSSGMTLSQLKDAVLSDRLFPKASQTSGGVAGRSLAWKLFLSKHEPLQASRPPRASTLLEQLKESRVKYTRLLAEKTKGPDDTGPETYTTPERLSGTVRNLNLNNPLSLDNENPWHEWFAALELKTTISQDVERTFPEITFFREAEVQDELTNILLVYSLTHPSIGYRQGMHELLAPLYHAVYFDSVRDQAGLDSDLKQLCSRKWVAADSWALFDTVMNGVSRWYEWQESRPGASGSRSGNSPLSGHVNLVIPEGQNGIQPYVAPIVKACNTIQNDYLKKCDPALWRAMQNATIEPQIYGIRWLRLLFTREFPMPDAMKLWDGLFACDPSLDLALWVCVAMLIRIRNELIPADYSGQLTVLLRYPSPPEREFEASMSHTALLLRQALFLQMSPTPASSATTAMENRTVLDIPIEVPEPTLSPTLKSRPPMNRPQSTFTGRASGNGGPSQLGHIRQSSSPALGIPEMLTRGLLERGESLGINKTLFSAVTELKKNIPDIATLMRSPNQNEMSFPLEGDRVVSERPPWEPRSRLEVEREVSDIKKRDRELGDSLGWIVDTLLQDESSVDDLERLKRKRREAVESLSYIRDVLISDAMDLDHERLIGEEETLRRKKAAKMRAEERKQPVAVPATTVTQPLPVSTIDSRTRQATERAFARSPPRATVPAVPATVGRKEGLQQAPWNYTRSSFTTPAAAAVPPASLPRMPPPTSTGRLKPAEPLRETSRSTGAPATKLHDPLGALG